MNLRLIFLCLALSAFSCNTPSEKENTTAANADTSWKNLSLREKIGQTMILTASVGLAKDNGYDSLSVFLEKYPIGGFFMATWTMFGGISEDKKEALMRGLVSDYVHNSKIAPFIIEDYEGGVGHALPNYAKIPAGMALGATNSGDLAYDAGKAIALEARSLGVNWVLHPVADINLNPLNPVTNIRCVSDDPEKAIYILSAQIKGLQQHGVAATIKHFPGDGVSSMDQHLTTSYNTLSYNDWMKLHGRVFAQLIDSGVYAIMTGHIGLPDYQKMQKEDELLPATLSYALTTKLLKQTLGFGGVVVSDALNMGGMQGYYPNQTETFADTLEARILRGEIPIERLNDAVSRIWNMKGKLGLFEKNRQTSDSLSAETKQFAINTALRISNAAVSVMKGAQLLPLDTIHHKKILIVVVAPDKHTWSAESFATSAEMLRSLGFEVEIRHNLSYYANSPQDHLKYDRVIFAFSRHTHDPIGSFQLQSDEALTAWMSNQLPHEKVIAISYGDPYVIHTYTPKAAVQINAYQNIEQMQKSVIDVLTGKIKASGQCPVKMPD